ncbi:lactococcin 972 family bacteriocin [Kribbella sp. NPDC051620]|uniref:lactococcin 972 family bacteriocin n=1 Tax=Kribbella sp. NPDC051620 TaxID=3364120 RepID=UPI0037AD0146
MRISKRIATGLGAVAVLATAAVPALASVAYPGGGTWNYGTNQTSVYSNYHHPSATHKSSTINGYGEYKTSGCVKKDLWANTSDRADPNSVDHAYWGKDC